MSGLVVKTAVAEYLKKKGVRTSVELYEALDRKTAVLLDEAVNRAKANKRTTAMAQDI